MADPRAKPAYRGPRPLPVGKMSDFLRACCERAVDDYDWTDAGTLWAHYRRWAFLTEHRPIRSYAEMVRYFTRNGIEGRHENRCLLLPYRLKDTRAEVARKPRPKKGPEVLGRVRITRALDFIMDGRSELKQLAVGTELPWMAPNERERADIRELYERQIKNGNKNPVTTLVVVWEGRRRLIPADATTRIG